MKNELLMLLAAALLLSPVSHVAADQPFRFTWKGAGGWGDKSAYCSLYDPKNIETMQGTIVAIETVTPMPGMSEGLEIELKTSKETIPVHLGPRWYLENQDINLQPQDKVVVKGSRQVCEGKRILAAAEVRKGDNILKLRDDTGRPLWVASAPHQQS